MCLIRACYGNGIVVRHDVDLHGISIAGTMRIDDGQHDHMRADGKFIRQTLAGPQSQAVLGPSVLGDVVVVVRRVGGTDVRRTTAIKCDHAA